ERLQQKAGLEKRTMELAIPPGLPPVQVDREKIMRVFLNLLNNALKYTPADGSIVIGASLDSEPRWVKVWVRDNGPGIPPAELERVFERFSRVEKSRSRDYGGTGLGLPIARRVVEAHGGRIWLESVLGEGTTAFFT